MFREYNLLDLGSAPLSTSKDLFTKSVARFLQTAGIQKHTTTTYKTGNEISNANQ
jgi:hypothetical protein